MPKKYRCNACGKYKVGFIKHIFGLDFCEDCDIIITKKMLEDK